MKPPPPARIHLLPAKGSPCVVVIRRKPAKCFHIIQWNTKTDQIVYGSWFMGTLYSRYCDVSFDGQWMVYWARGAAGKTWSGVCRLPYLRTVVKSEDTTNYGGGGYWSDRQTLLLSRWFPDEASSDSKPHPGRVPFRLVKVEDGFDMFNARRIRDGWRSVGEGLRVEPRTGKARWFSPRYIGEDCWVNPPTSGSPVLFCRHVGLGRRGTAYRFSLDKFPDLLDDQVDSACWDYLGNLIYSRGGVLFKYKMKDLRKGQPTKVLDLEPLQRPEKTDPEQ